MKKVTISIETRNAAFADDAANELARILRGIADRIEAHGVANERILDYNGNHVGNIKRS